MHFSQSLSPHCCIEACDVAVYRVAHANLNGHEVCQTTMMTSQLNPILS